MTSRQRHVVLVGDSIFDNNAYTGGEPDVVAHLRALLPAGWKATLLAEDGATVSHLANQLSRLPADTTDLVISIGGNDALRSSDLLSLPATSSADVLKAFDARLAPFERAYRGAIQRALDLGKSTTVCTVYNGALDPQLATIARLGLALFNDAILRTAVDLRLDALELRSICTDPADYANAIEPSGPGGLKIAWGIARAVGASNGAGHPARIWGQG
jgi:hypothetical protein